MYTMQYKRSNINDRSSLTFCIYPKRRLIFLNQHLSYKAIWIDKSMDGWTDGWMDGFKSNACNKAVVQCKQR